MKLNKHKELIVNLHSEGLSSSEIQGRLSEIGIEITPRAIRAAILRWKRDNTFSEILDNNGFLNSGGWSHGWLKTKEGSVFLRNEEDLHLTQDDIKDAIAEALKSVKPVKVHAVNSARKIALRGIITDAHVGMEPDTENAMFGFVYNERIFKKHLDKFYQSMATRLDRAGDVDKVIVDDLGDGLDGYNKQTTRGGHELQQNMSNKEQWRTYVFNKLETLQSIIDLGHAAEYEFRSVSQCNHSGDFGWTANMAIKMTIEQMYGNVTYTILNKPIERFVYGDHSHFLTHGKDVNMMKRNWPLKITDKISQIIHQCIDYTDCRSKYIHLDKGDLHQVGYDRNYKFSYQNYMSFAPPSAWVQANFGVSYCGYTIQEIPKHDNEIESTDVYFEMEKK